MGNKTQYEKTLLTITIVDCDIYLFISKITIIKTITHSFSIGRENNSTFSHTVGKRLDLQANNGMAGDKRLWLELFIVI